MAPGPSHHRGVMAELQTGDVIIGYRGRPLAPFPNLGRAVAAETPAGDAATLEGRPWPTDPEADRSRRNGAEGVRLGLDHPSPKEHSKP